MPVRVFGTVGAFMIVSGLFAGLAIKWLPIDRPRPYVQRVNKATGRCVTLPALQPLNRLPAQIIFTFIDLGPRLVTVTHHDAIAGPYHRNGDAILDVQHAFTRSPEEARAIMKRHGATLLLGLPEHGRIDRLSRARAGRLLRSPRARRGVSLADAGAARQGLAVPRVADRLAQLLDHAVDHELHRERGEQHAEQTRDHRLDLLP